MNVRQTLDLVKNTQTQTALDAYVRMDNARPASLANEPSIEYLGTLHNEVKDWLRAIKERAQQLHGVTLS